VSIAFSVTVTPSLLKITVFAGGFAGPVMVRVLKSDPPMVTVPCVVVA
jgi:hypothetical protein